VKDAQFAKLVLFTSSLVPAVLIAVDYFDGTINDPPTMMLNTGMCAVIFLALSLAVTPLRQITGKNYWSLFRRMMGLYAFFYAGLHLLIYAAKIQGWNVRAILLDAFGNAQNQFVLFGMSAFLLMVPLAATSTAWAIRKMGNKNWKLLHKLTYLVAIASALHLLTRLKGVTPGERAWACILGGLLLLRPLMWARDRWFPAKKPARPAAAGRKSAPVESGS
jgi:sulfoxide reductase heme-binding subunit YedZ